MIVDDPSELTSAQQAMEYATVEAPHTAAQQPGHTTAEVTHATAQQQTRSITVQVR